MKKFLRSSLVFTMVLVLGGASVSFALTEPEINGLLQMREEEKLARDVYKAMYAKWRNKVFYNISLSEQNHMDAVKGLLDKYGIEDPAAGKAVGVFTNAAIQNLYYELTGRGENSLEEAVCVGVIIEEMDIIDIKELLTATSRYDIIRVYNNLLNGSLNHLESFSSHSAYNADTCEGYQP